MLQGGQEVCKEGMLQGEQKEGEVLKKKPTQKKNPNESKRR